MRDGDSLANIPIRDMTQTGTPDASSLIVFDNGVMRKGTVGSMADAVRPVASQGEAEAGADNAKTMTPLRTKQSIASEIGVSLASKAQGDLANTALQPGNIGSTVQAYDADLAALAANSTDGLWAHTGAGTGAARTIAGTANEVAVANGAGTAGNPTLSLPSALTFTGKTVTGGSYVGATITTSTFNGNTWTAGTGVLTIGAGKTLTASNTLTFTGTDGSTAAFGAGGTVAYQGSTLAQFAATTSAQLAGVISDETGTGSLVFATTPTLVTPVLGVATATSINKVAFTAPATSATLTIPDGVTLTGPAASGTAMTLGNTETVTGIKTFGSAGAVGRLKVAGTTSGSTTLDASAAASGVLTLPAATDTLVGKATTDILTNKTINGANNSLTVRLPNDVTGTLLAASFPALTGDVTTTAGSLATVIGAAKVTSAMLNADVYSTAHTWSAVQTFSAAPVVPTQAPSDNSTKAASTAYVDAQVAGGVAGVASLNGLTGALTYLAGLHNRVINPNGQIWQFTNSGVAAITDVTYDFDQWYGLTETAGVTASQVALVEDGTPSMMRLSQANAGAQRFGRAQVLEFANCADLRGKAVVLSARVRMSASTTLRYAIIEWTGTADTVTKDFVLNWSSGTFTAGNFFTSTSTVVTATGSSALTANTLATVSLTGTVGSTANNIAVIFWTDSQQAQNVTLDIGKVQLEQGAAATPLAVRSTQEEQLLANRYYRVIGAGINTFQYMNIGMTFSATIVRTVLPLGTPMRIAPTATISAAVDFQIDDPAGAAQAVSALASSTASIDSLQLQFTSSGLTAGRAVFLQALTSSARIYLNSRM